MAKVSPVSPAHCVSASIALGDRIAQTAGRLEVAFPKREPQKEYDAVLFGELFPLVEEALERRDDGAIACAMALLNRWRMLPDDPGNSEIEQVLSQLLVWRASRGGRCTYMAFMHLLVSEPVPVPGEMTHFDRSGGRFGVEPDRLARALQAHFQTALANQQDVTVRVDPRLYSPAEILAAKCSGLYTALRRAHRGRISPLIDCVLPGLQMEDEGATDDRCLVCERYLVFYPCFEQETMLFPDTPLAARLDRGLAGLSRELNASMVAPFPRQGRVTADVLYLGGMGLLGHVDEVAAPDGKLVC